MTASAGKYNCEKRMALELEIFNLKVSYLLRKDISLLRPNLFVSKLIINCNSVNFLFSIFEIALQNANFDIVNFVIICIEMQWQRRSIFCLIECV